LIDQRTIDMYFKDVWLYTSNDLIFILIDAEFELDNQIPLGYRIDELSLIDFAKWFTK
jgi:hypothetical protein